ncbi:hypothetical protein VaNZ11_008105 [Volvox africanus]|uniref:ENTH domain-containing protein n=1 Tax=Volvox africanus TaxID=51714 RepID=A0ABQ5S5M8_9CHLO|nr:hypothetical protein VaNZ11_008105 [Volvox africanus]
MARVVEVVQIFKKVEDVTAAKEDPSPVYLMDELAEMARGSAESSEKIADRIAKRLQNKSPVVKFKALRLIRHLVNKGCAQFQRTMQRHASLIREHTQFKGEPDPFKGDTPNQRVRDAAKEASEALFNTVMAQPVTSLGSRIQGFGSSAAPPPSSGSSNNSVSGSGVSTSSSRMVGFGSSSYSAPAGPTNNNASAGFAASSPLQKGVNRPLTGSYGDAGSSGTATGTGTGTGSTGGFGAGGYTAPAVVATEVLGSEAQLVDSICTPGGLRLAPGPEDLRRFVEAAGNLDGIKLAELLRSKMNGSGPWQQQLRALYALEAVLVQGASQACGEVAVMFQSDPGPLQAATGHTQAVVRDRASRVLKLLLGNDSVATIAPLAAARTAPAPTPAEPAQMTADLLGGLDMLGGQVQAGYSSHQQQPQRAGAGATAGGADDIFSGLTLGTGTSPQQVPIHQQLLHQAAGVSNARPEFLDSQQQQQAAPVVSGSHLVVDPFPRDMLHPSIASHPQAAYTQQQTTSQWQQQPQHLQQAHVARLAVGGGLVGTPEPIAATTMGPGPGAPHGAHLHTSDIQPKQAAGVRPPLDDMFADMSISSNSRVQRPVQGVAAGSEYGGMGDAMGGVRPAYGGGIPGGGTGYGTPTGPFGLTSVSQMSLPSSSGVAMMYHPIGAVQCTAPHSMSDTGSSSLPHTQAQLPQQMARVAVSTHSATVSTADIRCGTDLLGPGTSEAVLGKGDGAYGPTGVGAGAGPVGGLGMGAYPAAGGVAPSTLGAGGVLPLGVAGSGSGGMMVGPGGQVLYVGSNVQPSTMMGPTGNLGPANGHLRQHTGSWQPPHAMQQQQQQHTLLSGVPNPHQDLRGGAAFDFVREQFK